MFYTLILILHVVVCLLLFAVILVQQGKGATMGAAFGTGGSQTVFGGSGAGNFLTKTTWVAAMIFFTTSLLLAYKGSFHRSVVELATPGKPAVTTGVKPGPKGTTAAPAAKSAGGATTAGKPAPPPPEAPGAGKTAPAAPKTAIPAAPRPPVPAPR